MTDYELKSYYLVKKLLYRYRGEISSSQCDLLNRVSDCDNFLFNLYNSLPTVFLDCDLNCVEFMKLASRRSSQKSRAKKYIQRMFNICDSLDFITLTFSDESLLLKPNVRRKYVLKWCQENCFDYYGNIDYGTKNQREHFHVLAELRKPYSQWIYGFMYVKPVNLGVTDQKRINTYMHKFVNHQGKETTGKSFHKRKSKHPSVEIYDLSIFEN